MVRSELGASSSTTAVGINLYRPQTKLRQGNVFTPVCHSVHKGGFCHPPGQTPPLADTPWADPPA